MDVADARQVMTALLSAWRLKSYQDLASTVGEEQHFDLAGATGTRYQGEILVQWESQAHGDILVMASVDDGGWRAFVPLTGSFIMRPDGTFVGE